VPRLLDEAAVMVEACRNRSTLDNPGVALGLVMASAAGLGRDKLTLVLSPEIASFGAWLEQLVAESTGKHGKAILPIDGEALAAPECYGDDRLFVYLRLRSTPDLVQDRAVARLRDAGHPVVTLELDDAHALPQELFRWQVATAVAGAVMRIDPFDQPDVEASKVATRAMTDAFESRGFLPEEPALFEDDGLRLFADARNAAEIGGETLDARLAAHLGRVRGGDYVALLAWVDMVDANERILGRIRHRIRNAKRVATCVGFGPRFLHSTGQAHKGGPDNGVFLQITSEDAQPLPIPGRKVDFGVVKAAQAAGDFGVLCERGRRALRIHLGTDVRAGLERLDRAIAAALAHEAASGRNVP
jgi:transaldolase / glucose-6-phosphate isomerase